MFMCVCVFHGLKLTQKMLVVGNFIEFMDFIFKSRYLFKFLHFFFIFIFSSLFPKSTLVFHLWRYFIHSYICFNIFYCFVCIMFENENKTAIELKCIYVIEQNNCNASWTLWFLLLFPLQMECHSQICIVLCILFPFSFIFILSAHILNPKYAKFVFGKFSFLLNFELL